MLVIPTGVPIQIVNKLIETRPLFADKTKKSLIKIIKRCNLLTNYFIHYFSFKNFSLKIAFLFIDFIRSKMQNLLTLYCLNVGTHFRLLQPFFY